MRRLLTRLFYLLPLAIMPLLYTTYDKLNRSVIVEKYGCGCPSMMPDGSLVERSFNANDFTRLFWLGMVLLTVIVSIFASRHLHKWYFKLLYIGVVAVYGLTLAYTFTLNMMWM